MSDMNLRTVATVVEGDMSLELKKSTIAIILKALSMLEEELEVNISTSPLQNPFDSRILNGNFGLTINFDS